jgi:hypothetical protein
MATEDEILATAKARFERCVAHYSKGREKARADIRFAAASPDDPWQWDDRQYKERETQRRPSLTINKLPQHIRQVTNDIRQNRPSIKFRPADNKADPQVAEILMGVVRHIEANSDADVAYDTAAEHQVTCGEGYLRVLADYAREDSFDQDIFIKRVKNPFRVFLDPDIQDPAGADAMFAFVEERLGEDEFKAQYPDADPVDWSEVGGTGDDWFTSDKKIRVCEYFDIVEKSAELLLWASGESSFKGDPMPAGVMMGERPLKTRKSKRRSVIWRKLTGMKVLDEKPFPCRYIPIARVVGNEWEVDGETITSGIVRNAKDSQRMFNAAQSAIVERVMQAPKAPWAAAAAAIEGYERIWQTANTANHSFLPFNHVDESGNAIPQPVRIQPASVEPGLTEVARSASDDIKAETGQYDASLGAKSNETSGRAIMARQREGDTATYHFVDNLARAVRHVGRIILDMYPKVYDTKRVALIIGEDDASTSAVLDPEAPQALSEGQNDRGEIERTFNPFIGTYDVYTTTGPSYTTRRVEAAQAMTELTQASPQLWGVIGDQLVKNMDWPGADEMAKRLKVTLMPEVRQMIEGEEGGQPEIPPQIQMAMQQMQQQMQAMGQQLQEAQQAADQVRQKAQESQDRLTVDVERLRVDQYRAETERMRVEAEAQSKFMVPVEVARIGAEGREEVAAIGALTQLEIAGMQPGPQLQAELDEGDTPD